MILVLSIFFHDRIVIEGGYELRHAVRCFEVLWLGCRWRNTASSRALLVVLQMLEGSLFPLQFRVVKLL